MEDPGFFSDVVNKARDMWNKFSNFLGPVNAQGPEVYANIGKKCRDILHAGYKYRCHDVHKLDVQTFYPVEPVPSLLGCPGALLASSTYYSYGSTEQVSIDINFQTSSKFLAALRKMGLNPRLKSTLSFKIPEKKPSTIELQYHHPYAGISANVELKPNPLLTLTTVIGTNNHSLGAAVSVDTKGTVKKGGVGMSCTVDDLVTAVTLDGKVGKLDFALCHPLASTPSSIICYGVSHSLVTNKTAITFGAEWTLNESTKVKARMNQDWLVNGVVVHDCGSKTLLRVVGDIDMKDFSKSKMGLSLGVKP